MNKYIGVVCATNRQINAMNIIKNYKRQVYKDKKLFIILNNNKMEKEYYKYLCNENKIKNFFIYSISEKKNLGYCLNSSFPLLIKENCTYFTKFDDDDHYGKYYILEAVKYLISTNATIIGKECIIIYIKDWNKYYFSKKNYSKKKFKKYTNHISGPTISFNINKIIKLGIYFDTKLPYGTDTKFQKDVKKKGGTIFSTSFKNFIFVRNLDLKKHTWKKKFKLRNLIQIKLKNKL